MAIVQDKSQQQEYLEFLAWKSRLESVSPGNTPGTIPFHAYGVPAPISMPIQSGIVPGRATDAETADDANEGISEQEESSVPAPAPTSAPFDDLVTRDELARLLRISGKTIERMAEDHRLPPGLDLGRKIWSRQHAYAWIVWRIEKLEEDTKAEMARLKL